MTQGRRIDFDPGDASHFPFPRLQPGDYGKDAQGVWHCRPPWAHAGGCLGDGNGVKGHKVVEHDNGTITVSPSILITTYVGTWHGFLEKGVWREC